MKTTQKLVELIDLPEFEHYADSLPDIVAHFDLDHRHVFVNRAIEPITGLTRDHYLGKTNRELGMPEELCELWEAQVERVIKSGTSIESHFEFISPTGPKIFHALMAPSFDQSKQVKSVITITRDVTSQQSEVEKVIRAAKISSAQHLTEQLSHQLNNPLSVLVGRLTLLTRDLDQQGALTESVQRQLLAMTEASTRINEIIESLQTIAKKSIDTSTEQPQGMRLLEIVSAAFSLCEERGIVGVTRRQLVGDIDVPIYSRNLDLIQALAEVLANAYEAAAKNPHPWVKVELHRSLHSVDIFVVDSGGPLKNEIRQKMMLPFYSTKGPSAKGLGLSTAKAKLQALGGSLTFDETAYHTTFKISIPDSSQQTR
jgi:PAS domain S-box-containing protein